MKQNWSQINHFQSSLKQKDICIKRDARRIGWSTFSKSRRGAVMETNCWSDIFPCEGLFLVCFPFSFSMFGAYRYLPTTVCECVKLSFCYRWRRRTNTLFQCCPDFFSLINSQFNLIILIFSIKTNIFFISLSLFFYFTLFNPLNTIFLNFIFKKKRSSCLYWF